MKSTRRYIAIWLVSCTFVLDVMPQSNTQTQFDILDGHAKVEIPFEYVHNFILVEVRLFGLLPMKFIFDTGAEHTILFKKSYADIFNVVYDMRIPIIGTDQKQEIYALVARSVDMEVLGLEPMARDILVLEENFFQLDEITGEQIHGILGGSFVKNVAVEINYHKQRLTLYSSEKMKPPSRSFTKLDLEVRSNKPYVHAKGLLLDNTPLDLTLLIDTGAGLPLLLHNNTHEKLQLPERFIRGKLGVGLGGYVEGYIGRIGELELSTLKLENILTSFQDLSSSIMIDPIRQRHGLIGNQLLSRFDIVIDYVREEMYIRPRRGYKKKFKMDKSGLVLFALGQNLNQYVVQAVIEKSPAEEAGLQRGDIIRRIQGLPASLHSLDHIGHILQRRNGKKIRLVIQRRGEVIKMQFRLRDLI